MRILINNNNEITGYATVGGLEGDFEISDDIIPLEFAKTFKPKYYLYQNEKIIVNPSYEEERLTSNTKDTFEMPGIDEELRKMFASMQVQIVQGNRMVTQLTQQNANLSQQIVQLSQEVENLKGGDSDETTVS